MQIGSTHIDPNVWVIDRLIRPNNDGEREKISNLSGS
jgi:hypothetical protein